MKPYRVIRLTTAVVAGWMWALSAMAQQDVRDIAVMVEFSAPPLARVWGDALQGGGDPKSATSAALVVIDGEHEAFRAALANKRLSPTVLFALKRVLNGVALSLPPADVDALSALPNVVSVRPLRTIRPSNTVAVPYVGGPGAWVQRPEGLLGQGVRVGVVDTGIDYLHKDFGGSGSPEDYRLNDRRETGDVVFPNDVIVGGIDLAGEDYDPDSALSAQPRPDDDPFDADGHGTHVAGTLGGRGVENGALFTGPYDDAVDFGAFDVGPGVAPAASLYAIKIFGAPGAGTLLVNQGLEYAVDPNGDGDLSDRLDVVNMSLGAPYNLVDGRSPEVDAVENAVAAGVVVVASSGNEGDAYFITGEPGAAPSAISVAASYHDGVQRDSMRIDSPPTIAGDLALHASVFGPAFPEGGITGAIADTNPRDACGDLVNPADLDGAIALVDRGECLFGEKVRAAQDAGAIAVLFVNNVPGDTTVPGGVGVQVSIPSGMIRQEEGARIRQALAEGDVVATLGTGEMAATGLADTMARFSSRGPAWDGAHVILKPDITAPGIEIRSAGAGTGAGSAVLNGTSMAAPQVAGAAALLRQAHEDWTPAVIKARLMNASLHDTFQGGQFTPPRHTAARSGAGVLDVARALENDLVAYAASAPEKSSLTFEPHEFAESATHTEFIRIENRGGAPVTVTPAIDTIAAPPGVTFALQDEASLSVDGGAFVDVPVELRVDRDALVAVRTASIEPLQSERPRHGLNEASAFLNLSTTQGLVARAPIFAVAEPSEAVTLFEPVFSGSGTLTLDASLPTTALLFELHDEPKNDSASPRSRDWGDLSAIGASAGTSAFDGVTGTAVYFLIATYGDWSSPNTFDARVELDFNGDGDAEYILFNTSAGAVDLGEPDDAFLVMMETAGTGAQSIVADFNGWDAATYTRPFLNNAAVYPLPLSALPASDRARPFRYRVAFEPQLTDASETKTSRSAWRRFDPLNPGIRFASDGPVPPHVDVNGETAVAFTFDEAAYVAANARGIAVVALRESAGQRVKILRRDGAVLDVRASDGAFSDRVRVTWTPLNNAFEYRVFRSKSSEFAGAQPLGDWQAAASFDDFDGAAPAAMTGCNGGGVVEAETYWVVSRRMGTATEIVGNFDTGFRAASLNDRADAGVVPWGDAAALVLGAALIRRRKRAR